MIVLLIISILVLFLVERWSIRHGLDRITYDVAPSQTLLEPDEEFTVRSTIENHKLWFVPYVSMVENFPSVILIPGEEESLSTGTVNTNIYVSSNSSAYQELASSQLTTAAPAPDPHIAGQASQAWSLPLPGLPDKRRRPAWIAGRLPHPLSFQRGGRHAAARRLPFL